MILPAFELSLILLRHSPESQFLDTLHGLCYGIDCDFIFCCLGSSHVHCWNASCWRIILYVLDHVDSHTYWSEGFHWVATMFRGSITFETPMLFSIAFVALLQLEASQD